MLPSVTNGWLPNGDQKTEGCRVQSAPSKRLWAKQHGPIIKEKQEKAAGPVVAVLGMCASMAEGLGLDPSSASDSSFLLISPLGGSRWWLKHLGSCLPCGRRTVFQSPDFWPGPAPALAGICQVNHFPDVWSDKLSKWSKQRDGPQRVESKACLALVASRKKERKKTVLNDKWMTQKWGQDRSPYNLAVMGLNMHRPIEGLEAQPCSKPCEMLLNEGIPVFPLAGFQEERASVKQPWLLCLSYFPQIGI